MNMKCQGCKFRVKQKLPMGGLRTQGHRICTKSGMHMSKRPVYRKDASGDVGSWEYPQGCNGKGYRA